MHGRCGFEFFSYPTCFLLLGVKYLQTAGRNSYNGFLITRLFFLMHFIQIVKSFIKKSSGLVLPSMAKLNLASFKALQFILL
ncbi:hypothetical protein DWQ65_12145 [Treponema phagedenis]|nr:hypothetical protein DWQ65_12145 [Treponema phagedenis]